MGNDAHCNEKKEQKKCPSLPNCANTLKAGYHWVTAPYNTIKDLNGCLVYPCGIQKPLLFASCHIPVVSLPTAGAVRARVTSGAKHINVSSAYTAARALPTTTVDRRQRARTCAVSSLPVL